MKDLPLFPGNPETAYKGKKVRVRGEVKLYKDRPEMVVRDSPEEHHGIVRKKNRGPSIEGPRGDAG